MISKIIFDTKFFTSLVVYVAPGCFILNGRYLRVKQRRQISFLKNLITQNNRLVPKKHRRQFYAKQIQPLMWQFFFVNKRFIDIQKEIIGYSPFWNKYLSILFAGLASLITYFAYLIVKKIDSNNMFTSSFLAFFSVLLLGILLLITLECSVIVYNNKEIHKLQRMFCSHVQMAWHIHYTVLLKV